MMMGITYPTPPAPQRNDGAGEGGRAVDMSETARRADALVENMADGVLILDRDGVVLWGQLSPHKLDVNSQQLTGQPAA